MSQALTSKSAGAIMGKPNVLPDGSEIYYHNGQYYLVNQKTGRSSNDQNLIREILAKHEGGDAEGSADVLQQTDRKYVLDNSPSALGPALNYMQGMPFVGEYFDEAIAANPNQKYQLDQYDAAYEQEHPWKSGLAGAAGGVAGTVAALTGGAAAGLPASLTAAVPNTLAGLLGITTLASGAEGLVSGYGRGQGPLLEFGNDRAQKSLQGGAIGAGTGALFGLGAKYLGNAANAAQNYVSSSNLARQLNKSLEEKIGSDAADAITTVVRPDGRAEAELGVSSESMLADAIPGVADAVAAASPKAAQQLEEEIGGRASKEAQRAESWLNSFFGSRKASTGELVEEARDATTVKTRNAYAEAYNTPIDWASDAGKNLQRSIDMTAQHISPNKFKEAVAQANRWIQTDPQVPASLKTRIEPKVNAAGEIVGFKGKLSVAHIDALKRSLDSMADQSGDPSYTALANMIVRYADEATKNADGVSSFATARGLGGNRIKDGEAVKFGAQATSPLSNNASAAEVAAKWSSYSDSEKAGFRQGFASQIKTRLDKAKSSLVDGRDPEDFTQGKAILNHFSSRDFQEKMQLMLSPSDYKLFMSEVERLRQAFVTRSRVGGNSATQPRGQSIALMEGVLEPGPVGKLMEGDFVGSSMNLIKELTGRTDKWAADRREKMFSELARVLTQLKGADAQRAWQQIREVQKKAADNPEWSKTLERLLSIVAAGGTPAARQGLLSYE